MKSGDQVKEAGTPTPIVAFSAAMYAMAHVDGDADPVEMAAVERIVGDADATADGLAWWEAVGTNEVVEQLVTMLDADQKLCLVANLIELAMVDGMLRSKEQMLLHHFRDAFAVEPAAYNGIFHALLVKNRLSIFR